MPTACRPLIFVSNDQSHGLLKIKPLADWSRSDVERFIAEHSMAYNVLDDRGYCSIGCAPCTRAIRPGEAERARRWWWESEEKKNAACMSAPMACRRAARRPEPWALYNTHKRLARASGLFPLSNWTILGH